VVIGTHVLLLEVTVKDVVIVDGVSDSFSALLLVVDVRDNDDVEVCGMVYDADGKRISGGFPAL
jgi:hypothetical protein